MPGTPRFVDLVQERLDAFIADRTSELLAVAPDLDVVGARATQLLRGGKRFRALFCYWGWRAVRALPADDPFADDDPERDLPAVVSVASGLEAFHAAALVHDDIMDHSLLRRGAPSVHSSFAALHRERGWHGSASEYGEAAALLLGDLLLGWSDDLVDEGVGALEPGAARAARAEFSRMRTEVTAGQYLDMLEEASWRTRAAGELLERARRVIVYKSAKYSVEAPLAIGATMAGASLDQLAALREFGLPLGIAFQLRDDLLGVFGDPDVTGKPAGDDLREGKRTVLVTIARERLPATAARLFDELVGDRDLDGDQIGMLRGAIRDSGAVEQVEDAIAHHVSLALAALAQAPIARSARDELGRLAQTVTRRES